MFSCVTHVKPRRAPCIRIKRMAKGGHRVARPENLHRPPHYPPVTTVVLGTDGTIWLRDPPLEGADAIWTVLDEAGEPLARIRIPTNVQLGSRAGTRSGASTGTRRA